MLRRFGWWMPAALIAALSATVALPLRGDDKAKEKPADKAAVKPKDKPKAKPPVSVTLAHMVLAGGLEEGAPSTDPLLAVTNESFKTKLDRIKKAETDANVRGLFLRIDGLALGWGKLDELSRAISDFRKTGKKVYAYLEAGSSKDYLLALACDEVCMPESATLMLTGVRAEVTFYKELFDKLGIKADMLKMGDAKTAAEPYTRTSLSPASRKQLEGVVNDYYENSMVKRVVASRPNKKFTAEQVKKIIDKAPLPAKAALEAGLIDRVAYGDVYLRSVKTRLRIDAKAVKVDVVKKYGQPKKEEIDFSSPFAILKLLRPPTTRTSNKPKVAVIYAVGAITSGKSRTSIFGGETCGSTTIIQAIRKAESEPTVKAIVLRVDSPGGSALASDLMWNELIHCKKPVIASMSDVAASGGYYISMGARKIYAEPGTLTGSIGVLGGKIALGGLYKKIGLKTETISRGANANIFSEDRPFSDSEKEAMTAVLKDIYDQFLDKALQGRKKAGQKMTRAELVKLAGGRVWTGRQAKANGLIDELGSLEDAVAAAKKMAGLAANKEVEILALPRSKGFLDSLLGSLADGRAPDLKLPALLRALPDGKRLLAPAEGLLRLRGEAVWLVMPYQISVR